MVRGFIDSNDVSTDVDCPRDPDALAVCFDNALGDACLAVAGIAIDEESEAGVQGLPDLAKLFLTEDQIGKRLFNIVKFGMLPGDRLGLNTCDIIGQGDRCGAEIRALL